MFLNKSKVVTLIMQEHEGSALVVFICQEKDSKQVDWELTKQS